MNTIRKWRRITQLLVVWTALMLGWLIDYTAGLRFPTSSMLWANAVARAIEQIGPIWFVGVVVGSAIWFATRPQPVIEREPPARDHMATITSLADLRDRGAITADEFEAKKAELLGRV